MSFTRQPEPSTEDLLKQASATPLPASEASEKAFLSGLMTDPAQIGRVKGVVSLDMLTRESYRHFYQELITMDDEGLFQGAGTEHVTVMLTNRLRDRGELERVGGAFVISEIGTQFFAANHMEWCISDIQHRYRLRRVIHGCALAIMEVHRHMGENRGELAPTLAACEQAFQTGLDPTAQQGRTSATLLECLNEHLDLMYRITDRREKGGDALIPTGFPSLDKHSGGIAENEYWLVTGPTKAGKSVLVKEFAVAAARRSFKTKIFTNEITRVGYTGRIIAGHTTSWVGNLERKGFESRGEQEHYGEAIRAIQQTIAKNMILDNAAGRYVEDIVSDIRRDAAEGVKLVVIDLLGKLRSRRQFGSREQEIAYMCNTIYDAGKRFNVATIIVAQENKEGGTRESQALEFDCEAWLRIQHVMAAPAEEEKGRRRPAFVSPSVPKTRAETYMKDRRKIVVELARNFAPGLIVPCIFDGERAIMRELETHHSDDEHWTDR